MIEEIISALEYAHQHSIIHRDIKPSNVILIFNEKDELEAKVVDFGLSKLLQDEQDVTTTGSVIGSPLYMSPEQARGKKADERSDIYSTGCLIYKMLTGVPPVEGNTPVEMFKRKLNEKPRAMKEANPDIDFPDQLEAIVSRCLEIEPEDRYSSMVELRGAIENVIENAIEEEAYEEALESESKADTSVEGSSKPIVAMFAVLAVIVVVTGSFSLTFILKPEDPEIKTKPVPLVTINHTVDNELDDMSMLISPETAKHFKVSRDEKGVISVKAKESADDESLKELQAVKNIAKMNLKKSKITGTGLKFVDCSKLGVLDLSESRVSNEGLKVISEIISIYDLNLSSNRHFTADGIKCLGNLKYMIKLKLSNAGITDDALKEFSKYELLKELDLSFKNEFTEKGILCLKDNNKLWWISLGSPGLRDDIFKGISQLGQLKKLTLDGLTVDELDRAFEGLANASIVEMDFANCSEYPDRLSEKIPKIKNLKRFIFQDSSQPTLEVIKSLKHVNGLQFVDFRHKEFKIEEMNALKDLVKLKSLNKISVNFGAGAILQQSEKGNPELYVNFVY